MKKDGIEMTDLEAIEKKIKLDTQYWETNLEWDIIDENENKEGYIYKDYICKDCGKKVALVDAPQCEGCEVLQPVCSECVQVGVECDLCIVSEERHQLRKAKRRENIKEKAEKVAKIEEKLKKLDDLTKRTINFKRGGAWNE